MAAAALVVTLVVFLVVGASGVAATLADAVDRRRLSPHLPAVIQGDTKRSHSCPTQLIFAFVCESVSGRVGGTAAGAGLGERWKL